MADVPRSENGKVSCFNTREFDVWEEEIFQKLTGNAAGGIDGGGEMVDDLLFGRKSAARLAFPRRKHISRQGPTA